ncbi:hypothetical protein OAI08_05875 [Gammaproteobacteria bacterium]|nr:hypothetical protein [Gammaproteobacteria bacterium]
MKNRIALAIPGGELINTNEKQRDDLRVILKTDNLDFTHVPPRSMRGQQVFSALVESGILKDKQWRR